MTQGQRSIAFFSTMLFAFGISSFKFEHPEYVNNELSYLALGFGLIMAIIFFVMRSKN